MRGLRPTTLFEIVRMHVALVPFACCAAQLMLAALTAVGFAGRYYEYRQLVVLLMPTTERGCALRRIHYSAPAVASNALTRELTRRTAPHSFGARLCPVRPLAGAYLHDVAPSLASIS